MLTDVANVAEPEIWDAIVIGGGPAGSVAALSLARAGRRVIVLEKAEFPRFHIGESLLPDTFEQLKKLGLESTVRNLPHMPKFGAEFAMGYGGRTLEIDFTEGFCSGFETFNIERAVFDNMLLQKAQDAGASVRQGVTVKELVSLADGNVVAQTSGGEIRGRYLLDASGQATVVGRHLGTRKAAEEPYLQKIAYFNQFEKVQRASGRQAGNPLIAMVDEGWFWAIPLDERRTSAGMVLDAATARRISRQENIPPDKMLAWGISRCPVMSQRMRDAVDLDTSRATADFSYRCRPYAGKGYFLIGDAATFMDPIFSTGVSVGIDGAVNAAGHVNDILAGRIAPDRARAKYIDRLEKSTAVLFQIIGQYYDHSFRELFMQGKGPLGVHKAVIGVLSGNVFPRPPWKLRWRLRLFDCLVRLNKKRQLVPRRRRFSLLKGMPAPQM